MATSSTDAVDQEFAQFRGQLPQFWLRQPAQISRSVDGLEERVLAWWCFCHPPQFIPSRPGLVMAALHVVESPQGRPGWCYPCGFPRYCPYGPRYFRCRVPRPGIAARFAYLRVDDPAVAAGAADPGDERLFVMSYRGHDRGRAGAVADRNAGVHATLHGGARRAGG